MRRGGKPPLFWAPSLTSLYIPIPHGLRESPWVWALEASLRGSYARFIDFSTTFWVNLVLKYDVPRLQAAAHTLQLVNCNIYKI